jgi:cytochrome P450
MDILFPVGHALGKLSSRSCFKLTRCRTDVWSISRDEDIFGPHTEYFRPERWLNASKEAFSQMERATDLVFGYGRYRCLGATLGWMEFNKVFFEILRQFEITVLNPARPMISAGHGIWIQGEFMVKFVAREDSQI